MACDKCGGLGWYLIMRERPFSVPGNQIVECECMKERAPAQRDVSPFEVFSEAQRAAERATDERV